MLVRYTAYRSGCGLLARNLLGTILNTGQFVVPSLQELAYFSTLPDTFQLSGSNNKVITMDLLRKGLRQRFLDEIDLSVGVASQFPTGKKDGFYNAGIPSEVELMEAAITAALTKNDRSLPDRFEFREVPRSGISGIDQNARWFDVDLHYGSEHTRNSRVSIVGRPATREYFVTWVLITSINKGDGNLCYDVDPKTGAFEYRR